MDLGSSDAQATSMSELAKSRQEGYQSAIRALQNFVEASDLDGAAYKSAKTYGMSVIASLIQGAILLSESTSQGVSALPRKYRAEVGDESLDSDILEAQIQAYENSLHSLRGLYRALEVNDTTSPWTLQRFSSQIDRLSEEKYKAMDKLSKLYAFASSSPNVFNNMPAIAEAMEVGIGQIKSHFADFGGQFSVPSGESLSWAKTINVEWRKKEEIDKNYQKVLIKIREGKRLSNKDVTAIHAYTNRYPNQNVKEALDKAEMASKTALKQKQFEERLAKMNRVELEEHFGTVINFYKRWTETGLGYSVKDVAEFKRNQVILARYQEVKDQPLTPKLKHLSPSKRAKMDKLSQEELEKQYPFLKNLTGRADWDIIGNITRTPAQREERSYAIHRYFEFENAKPISRFDPQFMEKRAAYINDTGKDPLTGLEASEAEKFTAKHYGWVKATADIGASISGGVADYSEVLSAVKNKRFSLNSDRLANLEHFTAPEVKLKIKKSGYSLDDFSYLVDADSSLSVKQNQIIKSIRQDIGMPLPKTRMNKTIPTEFVESYISGKRNSFGGFVSIDEHSKILTTLSEVYQGNRLDYPNTPFDLEKTQTYSKISFTLDKADQLYIPFSDVEEGGYPFTGRGFTGSQNIILPEYKLTEERLFQTGDTITIFDSKTGQSLNQYEFVKDEGWFQVNKEK